MHNRHPCWSLPACTGSRSSGRIKLDDQNLYRPPGNTGPATCAKSLRQSGDQGSARRMNALKRAREARGVARMKAEGRNPGNPVTRGCRCAVASNERRVTRTWRALDNTRGVLLTARSMPIPASSPPWCYNRPLCGPGYALLHPGYGGRPAKCMAHVTVSIAHRSGTR